MSAFLESIVEDAALEWFGGVSRYLILGKEEHRD
jgi:hypothetical protein